MPRSAFSSSRYDLNEIYTGSSRDKGGDDAPMRCKIPGSWATQISQIVHDPAWPEYKTPQAFLRDAIYHRLHWANEQRTTGRNLIGTKTHQLAELHQIEEDLHLMDAVSARFYEVKELMSHRFNEMLAVGDTDALRSIVADIESRAAVFTEPYQSMLRKELNTWEARLTNR